MSLDQELSIEKAPLHDALPISEHRSGANESERTNGSKGSLRPEAEGSPAPEVAEAASFERSVTRRPTASSRSVHISVKGRFWSRKACAQRSPAETGLIKDVPVSRGESFSK